MKPKPTPKKDADQVKRSSLDVYKGWLIECETQRWFATHESDGRPLWDSGFSSREELIATIDDV